MDLIDPEERIATLGAQSLIDAAEAYFSRLDTPEYHLSKPFSGFFETPTLLHHLGATVELLEGWEGIRVLDFGAGSCWMSRVLAQLGAHVVATDVSPSALQLGRELLRRHPLIGDSGSLDFLDFDGEALTVASDSFDRVVVSDAWHHVVDQEQTLSEFARVLTPDGIVVISDVGPQHSRSPQSQYEMNNFRVVERDTDADALRKMAQAAGFDAVEAFIYAPAPLPIVYESLESGYRAPDGRLGDAAMNFHADHRLIRLRRGQTAVLDSRRPNGLAAVLHADYEPASRIVTLRVVNTGSAVWLTDPNLSVGRVNIGVHLLRNGVMVELDHRRVGLSGPVRPGEERTVDIHFGSEPEGTVVIDLVAEGVAWFEAVGTSPVVIDLGNE